jgi:Fur family ferric uptake transcriptional regulator
MASLEMGILESYLRDRRQKVTRTRKTVLEAFLSMEGHVTAESLLATARNLDPGIGQATVFRALHLFAEAGLAREACRDEGARSYEHAYMHSHHDHLRCVRCGTIVEFCDPGIEQAQEAVFSRFGFAPADHRMELVGICPDCQAAAPVVAAGQGGVEP